MLELEGLLAWHNLIFAIPFVTGLLLVLGIGTGVAHLSHEVDAGGAAEGSHDAFDGEVHEGLPAGEASHADGSLHGAEGGPVGSGHSAVGATATSILSLLGFGKVPLVVVLTSMALTFGCTGMIANLLLAPLLAFSSLFALLSFALATVVMVVATGIIARTVARFAPSLETASTTKTDLLGCEGTLVLASDTQGGLALVRHKGDVYQVRCISSEPLPKGAQVLLTDYNAKQNVYTVCSHPLAG